jgi:carbon storage regulator
VLVLSRKRDQSVLVGDEIVVTVLGIDGDRVKLGITAPRSVTVLRQEVFEQLRSANTTAVTLTAPGRLRSLADALRRLPESEIIPAADPTPQ